MSQSRLDNNLLILHKIKNFGINTELQSLSTATNKRDDAGKNKNSEINKNKIIMHSVKKESETVKISNDIAEYFSKIRTPTNKKLNLKEKEKIVENPSFNDNVNYRRMKTSPTVTKNAQTPTLEATYLAMSNTFLNVDYLYINNTCKNLPKVPKNKTISSRVSEKKGKKEKIILDENCLFNRPFLQKINKQNSEIKYKKEPKRISLSYEENSAGKLSLMNLRKILMKDSDKENKKHKLAIIDQDKEGKTSENQKKINNNNDEKIINASKKITTELKLNQASISKENENKILIKPKNNNTPQINIQEVVNFKTKKLPNSDYNSIGRWSQSPINDYPTEKIIDHTKIVKKIEDNNSNVFNNAYTNSCYNPTHAIPTKKKTTKKGIFSMFKMCFC